MLTITEERVALLEGQVMEHVRVQDDIRQTLRSLDDKTTRYFMWMVGIQVTALITTLLTLVSVTRR